MDRETIIKYIIRVTSIVLVVVGFFYQYKTIGYGGTTRLFVLYDKFFDVNLAMTIDHYFNQYTIPAIILFIISFFVGSKS